MPDSIPVVPSKIFISHAWEDKALVRRLEDELKAAGAEVWVDHSGVRGGDNLPKRISDALEWCDTVLLIWSEAAKQSHWVELEWTNGISLKKTIIPCLLSQVQLPGMLVNRLYVDFRNLDQGLAGLLRTLQLERSSKTKFSGVPTQKQIDDRFPDIELKDRRIDSAVPSQAEVGQRIDLLVQVRFPDSPLLGCEDWPTKTKPDHVEQTSESVGLEFPVDPRTGRLDAARLEVQIVAPDFEIAGTARQRLLVPPEEYSKCLAFLITPKKTGVCRINVEIYNIEQIFLGAIPLETNIGGMPAPQAFNVANLLLFVVVAQERTAARAGDGKKQEKSGEPEPSSPAVVREPKESYEPTPRSEVSRAIEDLKKREEFSPPTPQMREQVKPSLDTTEPKESSSHWQHTETAYGDPKRASRGCLSRAVLWLGLLASLVTVLAFISDLPQKLSSFFTPASGRFSGRVHYPDGSPVANAVLRVQGKRSEGMTDAHGNFDFNVQAKPGAQIRVTVEKDGRVGYDDLLWLNGKNKPIPFDTTQTPEQK